MSLSVRAIFLNLLLVNGWQLEYQETTFGPGDRLLYFLNHIHRGPNSEESSEEGREVMSLERRQRGITYSFPPRDPSKAAHRRDSNSNAKREGPSVSCDHAIQPSATLAKQPARPAVRGGPQGESTRVLNLDPCRTGGKEGAW